MSNSLFMKIENISKSFPGVKALNRVDLELYSGEALALIGANGAGKSTLMNIIGGVLEKDEGQIFIEGAEVQLKSPIDALRHGISFVHQEMALFPSMTIAENIYLTDFPRNSARIIEKKRMYEECQAILSRLSDTLKPSMRLGDLSAGDQQMVEIARALRTNPKLIIFDEPTSSLTDTEKRRLFTIIDKLKTQGSAIVYITHMLDEVFTVCDKAVVLRNGETVGGGKIKDLDYQTIVKHMIGEKQLDTYLKSTTHVQEEKALEVRDLGYEGVLSDISFSLHKGEVVGLWGLLGAGRSELIRSLVGLDPIQKGEIYLRIDSEMKKVKPKEVHKQVGIVTENRRLDGLLLPMSVRENMSLANLPSFLNKIGLIDTKKESKEAKKYRDMMSIKISSIEQRCETLSGGNQQKVIIGRWLQRNPEIFLLDEPTRGLDVGAKAEIHQLIEDFVSRGAAVLVVSSDIDEIMALSDRFIVLHQGRIVTKLDRDATKTELMSAATGIIEER
jgi:ABC-type sugar transport system ATPase subunit